MQQFIEKIPQININPKTEIICVYNKFGQKVCYDVPSNDSILCDDKYCKISFRSPNQTYLGKEFPKGINIGIRPRGAFAAVHIFGIFDKNNLSNVQSILNAPIQISTVDKINNPTFDLPNPPKKCRFMIWADECRPYIESLDWNYSIFKGWKRDLRREIGMS